MMKSLFLTFFILFNVALAIESEPVNINSSYMANCNQEWFSCSSNNDCEAVMGMCGSRIPVNSKFQKEVLDCINKQFNMNLCKNILPSTWPSIAFCDKGKCKLNWNKSKK